jgi:hypothetical protein
MEQEKKKRKDPRLNKKDNTQKRKVHNGESQEEKPSNPCPKPITSSKKQVVEGEGQK